MEREACVCDHGFERSDFCAEIIIIIIIIIITMWRAPRTTMVDPKVSPKDWHSTNQFLDMPRACPP